MDEPIEYAILMVVHNACDMVKMSSLRTLKYCDNKKARLIVVDNASNDGVEQWLSVLAQRGDIELIRSDKNIGHGPGLELARKQSQSKYIVSLDSDAFPLCDNWLEQLSARLTGDVKIAGIYHHRDYIHPSCLMIQRQCMDELGLTFLNEKSQPSQFDVAERMSQEVKRRGFSISGLQRNAAQRRGSVSEPIYLGSSYDDLVYHQWYTTRSDLENNDQIDDVPAGAITDCLKELYQNYLSEPSEISVIIGVRAEANEKHRIRNVIAVVNAINLQNIARWRYRLILVEQDSEPHLQHLLAPLVDHYQFIYNPGPYNRGWSFNVGATLVSAKTGHLCLLDADLLVPEDFLSRSLDALHSGLRALRPFTSVKYLDDSSSERALNKQLSQPQSSLVTDDYAGRVFTDSEGGCIWVEAALYQKIGGHDERFKGWGGEDREFSHRLARNTEIHNLHAELLHLYHPEPASDTCWTRGNNKLLQKLHSTNKTLCSQTMGDLHRYAREQPEKSDFKNESDTPGQRDWEHWQQWSESKIENTVNNERRTPVAQSLRKQLVDHVATMGSHILDLGCGAGAMWPHFQNYQPNISWVGVDVTDKMLQVAHRLFPEVPLVRADAGSLPFDDQSFDVVVLRHVLEHMPPWLVEKSLSESLRIARNAVIIDFYIPPSNKGQTKSERVAEGFFETSWAESELNQYIELAAGRVFQKKIIRAARGQVEEMWFIEPATALQNQALLHKNSEASELDYKVSIIMPTYRRQHTIYRTIELIKKQTYQNWELIVVDNEGHEDYCFDDPRIHLYRHPEVTGSSYARNKGIQYATGDLLCFFDDDDDMFADYLEKFVNVFRSKKNVKMVCCGMIVSNGSVNYSYATPECCLRRGYATPTWPNDGSCQDQRYFKRIVKLRGWSEAKGDIAVVKQALCQANTDLHGGLREGNY